MSSNMSTDLLSFGHFYVTFYFFSLIIGNIFQRVLYMISKIGTVGLEK